MSGKTRAIAVAVACFCASFSQALSETRVRLNDLQSDQVKALDLQDPFFKLVLDKSDQPGTLRGIQAAMKGTNENTNVFVVSEHIKDPGLRGNNIRRAVISYNGEVAGSAGEMVDIDGTVMLSVFFDPHRFPLGNNFEAWGWDQKNGRYNYYRRENTGWEFRGSSDGPDVATRSGCMRCHHNGTPIMKEFMSPWPNWHSFEDLQPYLANTDWPSMEFSDLASLQGAEDLELQLLRSLRDFHDRQIALSAKPGEGLAGGIKIENAWQLLRSIFETTEVNLASSLTSTGNLHPFSQSQSGPINDIAVPDTFFLNARVIGNASPAIATLGIVEAMQFHNVARIPRDAYEALLQRRPTHLFKEGLACNLPTAGKGDAAFAWLHPEPGLFDVLRVESLLKAKIVDREFVAAAMAIDLRQPIYSDARKTLLAFMPDSFTIAIDGSSDLKAQVLAAIRSAGPATGSPAAVFAERLESGNAVDLLKQDVASYLAEVRADFADTASPDFDTTLERYFSRLNKARRNFVERQELCDQIEGPAIPLQ